MYKKVWCLCRDVVYQSKTYSIGQFRVSSGLCIKTRIRAQPLMWKWFFILIQIKLIFTRKLVHLASFWTWGFLELGSGLLLFYRSRWLRRRRCVSSLLSDYRLLFAALLMFFLHLWPLQFYIWLNIVTTVSAFGFKFKEFAWFLPRFSLKVLLPDVFLNIFTATDGVSSDPPSHRGLTEQIEDNIQPVPK